MLDVWMLEPNKRNDFVNSFETFQTLLLAIDFQFIDDLLFSYLGTGERASKSSCGARLSKCRSKFCCDKSQRMFRYDDICRENQSSKETIRPRQRNFQWQFPEAPANFNCFSMFDFSLITFRSSENECHQSFTRNLLGWIGVRKNRAKTKAKL